MTSSFGVDKGIETLRWDNENGNRNLIRHATAVDVAVSVVLSLVITIFA